MIESGGYILAEDVGGDWTSFVPTWIVAGSSSSLADGSIVGRYKKVGRIGVVTVRLTYGSATAAGSGGQWSFGGFPADIDRALGNNLLPGYVLDAGPGTLYPASAILAASGATAVLRVSTRTAAGVLGTVTQSHPFAWAAGDILFLQGTFQTGT